jgi:hypothetical protein
MKYISTKRIMLGFCTFILLGMNMYVHIGAMQMSEKAMYFERQIATLKQNSLKLEDELTHQSSLNELSAIVAVNGYTTPVSAARWIHSVEVAAR